MDYDLIVIGGGSGGLTAAIGGSIIGAKTLLIEKEKLGGDCTHFGCVPSKTLIKAARVVKNAAEMEKFGLFSKDKKPVNFDLKKVLQKVQKTVSYIEEKAESVERLEGFGLEVMFGDPKFVDKNAILVNGKKISSKKFVIATGSRARVPPIKGLDKIKYMTNKEIFIPKSMKSIGIIGGGPIGSELGQAFSSLGVDVSIFEYNSHILNREDKDASRIVENQFKKQGIKIFTEVEVFEVKEKGKSKVIILKDKNTKKEKEVLVDELLVASGRVPNVEGLDLEKAGVKFGPRGIKINPKTQTTNKRIYAVGDVAGGWQFTHFADHQGKIALTNAIFKFPAKFETKVIPRSTFTTPEIASVGETEEALKNKGEEIIVLKKDYADVDRAITESETDGFYKIITDKKGFVKGAVIVGEGAGELIGEVALVMKNGLKVKNISATIHPYPTFGLGLRQTADLFMSKSFTPNKKKWVKRIFGLRGK